MVRILFSLLVLFTACSEPEKSSSASEGADCKTYQEHIRKLENRLLETERNADRLEDVIYRLTQNYMVIDQKIRLIQKFRNDASQARLLTRTASEINRFFEESQALLDTTEMEIKNSSLPQSSILPIVETVRTYLTHQEKLFIEVYGSIGSIQQQVARLRETVKSKEKELAHRTKAAEQTMEEKEKENRKIYYLVGSRPELERAKAIRKSGGFLGVGSSVKLSEHLEEMFFQKGDYLIVKDIALGNTKKIELITTHPKGTYLIVDTPGERFLKITNPEKFWSTSRFLVVEVD